MLPAERRIRRRAEFTATVRDGSRIGATGLVLHLARPDQLGPARAGFIVGRSVGSAVTRNQLRRRLRHVLSTRLADLPPGSDLVVRVTPAAARLPRRELTATFDRLLDRASAAVAS